MSSTLKSLRLVGRTNSSTQPLNETSSPCSVSLADYRTLPNNPKPPPTPPDTLRLNVRGWRERSFGDKLQLLAMLSPDDLASMEELVDYTIEDLLKSRALSVGAAIMIGLSFS